MPFLLRNDESLTIVTISDRGDAPQAWAGMIRAASPGHVHFELGGPDRAGRNLWAARLDEMVRQAERPVILAAYGVSCFAVAWWARLSPVSYVEHVAGALFLRPLERMLAHSPEQRFAGPKTSFAFPSIMFEDGAARDATRALADEWGSRFSADAGGPLVEELLAGRGKVRAVAPVSVPPAATAPF